MRKNRNYERVGDENEDEDVVLDDNQEALQQPLAEPKRGFVKERPYSILNSSLEHEDTGEKSNSSAAGMESNKVENQEIGEEGSSVVMDLEMAHLGHSIVEPRVENGISVYILTNSGKKFGPIQVLI
jgi:hypothetical protein